MDYDEIHIELPVKIAKIEVQKKNIYRYSLFSEDGFILGVSESVLIAHNIKTGTLMTEGLLAKIQGDEHRHKIRDYMIRLLARRDHASFELAQKASKKGFEANIVGQIISELEEKGYINNKTFALKYAKDKFRFNKWGSNKIRNELFRKNINSAYIEEALDSVFGADEVVEVLRELTIKRKASLLRTDPSKRKKKLFDFLIRKGYDIQIVLKEMDSLLKLITE